MGLRKDTTPREPALFASTVAGTGHSEATVGLREPLIPRIAARPAGTALPRYSGHAALVALVLCCAAIVVFASSGPTLLVWHSNLAFPGWVAGPVHGLFGSLRAHVRTLQIGFLGVMLTMLIAYGVVLLKARELSMRAIWVFVVVVYAILLIGPPLQASDIFNYLGYARLGALHGFNPYAHVIHAEAWDPVALLASWHNYRSAYGPLFTALTYPLGRMPLPAAYWLLKTVTVLMNIVFLWLVGRCATLRGRDPRWVMLFVAANPLFLVQEVGGFHNDVFMMVPLMAAIAFLLAGHHRSTGAAVAVAVAMKFTAILILPFVLLAAPPLRRRLRIVGGFVIAGIPLLILTAVMFGSSLPNLGLQSQILTAYSIANMLGWAVGLGGAAPVLLKVLELCVVAVVVHQLLRNRDWIAGAGWATVALLASLGGLWPWYLVWLFPLAALSSSVRLRNVALGLTVLITLTSAPFINGELGRHGINPLSSQVGHKATATANKYSR